MYKGATIAAVVPAYKEEAMIATVVSTMPAFVDHIVIVDDCSPDGTSDVVRAIADPRVTLIRHEVNKGVGGAIITAHKRAMELGADVNVVMAGDAQMDPDHLPSLLDAVTSGGYGFAKANRFFREDSYSGMPAYRIFGNIVLSFMTKFASGYWHLFDPQNGYTAVRTSILANIPLDAISERYSFENDLLIRLNVAGVPATDVPIPAVYGNEVSSIRLSKVVPELIALLFKGFWHRIWYRYVLWSFSAVALLLFLGLFLLLCAAGIGAWIFAMTLGPDIATAGTVLLAVTPFILGVQMLVSALQLDIQATPDQPTFPPFEHPGDNVRPGGRTSV